MDAGLELEGRPELREGGGRHQRLRGRGQGQGSGRIAGHQAFPGHQVRDGYPRQATTGDAGQDASHLAIEVRSHGEGGQGQRKQEAQHGAAP